MSRCYSSHSSFGSSSFIWMSRECVSGTFIGFFPWSLVRDANEVEKVRYQRNFNLNVKLRFTSKRWWHIHLKQPRLQIFIDQNIKADKVKAVFRIRHIHVHTAVCDRINTDDSLDNQVIDLHPNSLNIDPQLLHSLLHLLESLLRPPFFSVHFEILIKLIDRVIGQMLEDWRLSRIVLFCCKSGKSFVVDVDSKRVEGGDDNVDSEIKFKAVEQKRIDDVVGDD